MPWGGRVGSKSLPEQSSPQEEAAGHPTRRIGAFVAHSAWVLALTVLYTVSIGSYGFNPTDQGTILAQSWRILRGEVPHRDIVSARPLGSAYLHTVDILAPGPLFLWSIGIATLQIVVMTVALASWVSGRPVSSWSRSRTALVAAAAMLNLHLFPVHAWHTIDGLFLTAIGWWALDRGLAAGRVSVHRLGLFLLGFAAITKQSFVPAVLVGLVMLLAHRWRGRKAERRITALAADLAILGAAPASYLLHVTVAGGHDDLIAQLTGGAPAVGQQLWSFWTEPSSARRAVIIFALAVVSAVILVRSAHVSVSGQVCAGSAIIVVVITVVEGNLERAGSWAIALLWMLAAAVVGEWALLGRVSWRLVGLLLLGWMASLSWGYASPTLIAGSLVLAVTEVLGCSFGTFSPRARPSRPAAAGSDAASALLVVATFLWLSSVHAVNPYRDRPHAELTADLGPVAPEMRGVRTTPSTYEYVAQIAECVQRHPADEVAVLPDNPFVYPVLGLHNPFPIDWPLQMELVADTRERMRKTAERLNAQGDYLVLFQTVSDGQLAAGAPVPSTVPATSTVVDPAGIADTIRGRLQGRPITCGSFVGVWAPRTD